MNEATYGSFAENISYLYSLLKFAPSLSPSLFSGNPCVLSNFGHIYSSAFCTNHFIVIFTLYLLNIT